MMSVNRILELNSPMFKSMGDILAMLRHIYKPLYQLIIVDDMYDIFTIQ